MILLVLFQVVLIYIFLTIKDSPNYIFRIVEYPMDYPELAVCGDGGREAISVEKQLLIALWFGGSNATITKIADRLGVSESSIILSRTSIMDAILNNLMTRFITLEKQKKSSVEKMASRVL